uniref:Large ribosomal subunit protein uL6c n=1 Tax=Scinaia undulata TaxID=1884664 RepID=A0A1G4NXW1_9FLOR|nr:Ribosomal protein L6 [Scinaia undulata]SCW23444.1 Ribosomal protein L6 [Scinaia undulata]
MSRIGKKDIILSKQIDAKISGNTIYIKGPKGQLSQKLEGIIQVDIQATEDKKILSVKTEGNSKKAQQLHGLSRTLINNMVIGVQDGFSKSLEIRGVGYRSQMDGKKLILNVGFSHPVTIDPPSDIIIKVENSTRIIIAGANKETVGQTAAKIRAVRPPEPYKGKGIRYSGEIVKKKIGKAGK